MKETSSYCKFLILTVSTLLLHAEEETRIPSFVSGMPLPSSYTNKGYSQGAQIDIGKGWSFSLEGTFTEYAFAEDSMEVAYGKTSEITYLPFEGEIVRFDGGYEPGFKVGALLSTPYDEWNLGLGYLWFRGHSHVSKEREAPNYYFSPLFIDIYATSISSLNANWDLDLDLLDLYLSRPYYSGTRLVVFPEMGIRGSFIRQKMEMLANVIEVSWSRQIVTTKSKSWGVGPRLGFQTNYLLGGGVSLFGNLFSSLLYTRYNRLHVNYVNALGESAFGKDDPLGFLRPILDMGLGLDWGIYSKKRGFYFDLSVAYDFSIYFSQNRERMLISNLALGEGSPANLYLHGVSIGAAVVF